MPRHRSSPCLSGQEAYTSYFVDTRAEGISVSDSVREAIAEHIARQGKAFRERLRAVAERDREIPQRLVRRGLTAYLDLADCLLIAEVVLGVPAEGSRAGPASGLASSPFEAPAGFGGVESYPM